MSKVKDLLNDFKYIPYKEGGKYSSLFDFNKVSSIIYLLKNKEYSAFHNNSKSDEHLYFIEGESLIIHAFIKSKYKKIVLNKNANEYIIKKGTYYALENENEKSYSILIRVYNKQLNIHDIIIPKRGELISLFPENKKVVLKFTKI